MKILYRADYLEDIKSKKDTPDIKVITGIRRCGKSELMKAFISELHKNAPDCNIVYADLSIMENENLLDYHNLYDWVKQQYKDSVANYLLLDEVQLCKGFEKAINSLHASGTFDIYLTGSNAFMLSADLATLFTGRYIEIHMMPFSFDEYCRYNDSEPDIQKLFDRYVVDGGLPGSYLYTKDKDRVEYIRNVYHTILRRDLAQRYNLSDSRALEHIAEYMMDNVSNITSPNNVSRGLNESDMPTSHVTVGCYLKYLCDAFVLYKVKRYDIRGSKYLQSLDKYYLVDTGIRFALLGRRNMDYGRIYENVVAMELIRRGYDIYVGKLYEKEVDFVAVRNNERLYIQVSDDISAELTFKREVEPLLQINDAYPKCIIARTRHDRYDYRGVQIYDLALWLKKS